MKLSEIKANPNNPRLIKDDKFKKLVKSIKEFPKMMALRPMVVDANGVVLGGNMRLKALQELKYKEVCNTIGAQGGYNHFHSSECRQISKNEICMIGTYPLDYNFKNNKWHYLIGMSVPPVMTAQIANQIYSQWFIKTE